MRHQPQHSRGAFGGTLHVRKGYLVELLHDHLFQNAKIHINTCIYDPDLGRGKPMKPHVTAFFDDATNTISYVVREPQGRGAAVIDSVLDFDYASGRTDTASADEIIAHVEREGLDVQWILETHVHADHLSAAPYGKVFNEGTEFQRDGSQFDALFKEGDSFHIGQMRGDVLHTPGHTPACLTYVIGDAAFVGDTLFMPDFGTARCDFPGGSAHDLYKSIQKILALPDETRIFVGHDYKAPGREDYAWESTVGEQKAKNVHVGGETPEDVFVELRESRDATLGMPRLILPSLQVNMRAGNMPEPDDKGNVFLKVPVNKL